MSGPKWTPAQQAAIADRGGALLVSAAAGSGKTAVLTERAVQLITDPEHPVNADRLLIVTFTNAAAAELRARIGQALLKRSQAEPGNGGLLRRGPFGSAHGCSSSSSFSSSGSKGFAGASSARSCTPVSWQQIKL